MAAPAHEKGPSRGPHPTLGSGSRVLKAKAERGEGDDQAHGDDEGWDQLVERAFERDESHGEHPWVGNPGGAGLSVWTNPM